MTEEKTADEIAAEKVATEKAETEAADKKVAEEKAAKDKALEDAKSPEQKNKEAYMKRKLEENEKLKLKLKESEDELKMFKGETGDDDLGKKIKDGIQDSLIETKVSEFIKKFPDLADDREKIIQYARDPGRKSLPLEEIISGAIGFEKALKLGAKMKAQIEEEAKAGQFGGDDAASAKEKTEIETGKEKYDKIFDNMPMFKNMTKS